MSDLDTRDALGLADLDESRLDADEDNGEDA
jgi:hypothetical protein